MEGVNTQDFTQESNMSNQTPDTQIVPHMTSGTPNYSTDAAFENDYGHLVLTFLRKHQPILEEHLSHYQWLFLMFIWMMEMVDSWRI